ncbi:unnamed protein product [Peniophora sp. CBMAI 1063]|nr:unnamed protein product [Peniophora sp. CBMAI 1063]
MATRSQPKPPPPLPRPARKSQAGNVPAPTPAPLPLAGKKRPLPKFKKKKQEKPTIVTRTAPEDVDVAVEWPGGMVLLGVGTSYRPPAPEKGLTYAEGFGGDGLWRWHEFTRHPELLDHTAPFMAWAHIPTQDQRDQSILYRRASRQDCARLPDEAAEGKEMFEGRKKLGKKGMGTVNGMYRLTDELYKDMKARHTTLRQHCDFATRLLKRASKECMDGVSPHSVIRVILANVREPVREYLDVVHACEHLRYGRISAFQEFDVCFSAFQRAHNVMLAYFDFACSILPPSIAPGLAELPKLTSSEHRRGVVLAGEDIKTYIRFFKAHRIPVWVVIRVILANVREPVREYLDVVHACERLRYGRISVFQEFDVCFSAFQRALNVMLAYFDFACSILPPSIAPGLAELPKLTSSEQRRGVVLAGEDIKTYIRFFKAHRIPVWVYAAMNTIFIPAGKLGPPDSPRCDVSACPILNDFKQRSLPLRWYPPPPHCPWAMIEPIGRGYVPRPDEDSFELGQEAAKKKKKWDGALKRQEEIREGQARKLENLKNIFGDLGSSLERYQKMAVRSPAAQRYFANKIKPRPAWAPPIDSTYMVALDGAMKHLDFLTRPLPHPVIDTSHPNFYKIAPKIPREQLDALLEFQRSQLVLKTWVPPLSVFTNPTKWEKTVELVSNAVTLLPVMFERLYWTRHADDVHPLTPTEWRDILTITHWKGVWNNYHREKYIEEKLVELRTKEDWDEAKEAETRAQLKGEKIPLEPYIHEEYDKYGSPKFFGQRLTDEVISCLAPGQERWNFLRGDLTCGHPATKERLIKDPELVHNILLWFELLSRMFWFADLNSQALAREGVPASADGWRHTPIFSDEKDRQRPTAKLIMQAVIHHQVVDKTGWPGGGEDAGDTFMLPEDLGHIAQLLIGADHAHFVDQYMERDLDWYTVQDLRELMPEGGEPFGSVSDAEFGTVTEQLLLRYILTSFGARQWPVEFTTLPRHSLDQYKCMECRPAAKTRERPEDDADAAAALSVALGTVPPTPHPHLGDPAPMDTGMDVRFQYDPDPFWESYDGHLSDEPGENEGFSD